MNLKGRSFLKLLDFTPEEITYLLDLAADVKEKKKNGIPVDHYKGKNIALIFEKTSTRTRCAFEVAAHDMGMGTTYLDPSGSQIGKKESIEDTARVLGRMYDGIEYRGFGQDIVEELAKYAGVDRSYFYRNLQAKQMVEDAQLKQGECYNPKKAIFDRATEEVNKQLKRQMILYKRRIKELELQIELLEEENQKLKESK